VIRKERRRGDAKAAWPEADLGEESFKGLCLFRIERAPLRSPTIRVAGKGKLILWNRKGHNGLPDLQ
jgi:hypothetical protein